MNAIEFYKKYFGLKDEELDEQTRVFLQKLENELMGDYIKHENELIHIILSPKKWREFVEYLKEKKQDEKNKTVID
jgi:hypothetical protein